jgi:hypothetical protein
MANRLDMAFERAQDYYKKHGKLPDSPSLIKVVESETSLRFAPGDSLIFEWAGEDGDPATKPVKGTYRAKDGFSVVHEFPLDIRK